MKKGAKYITITQRRQLEAGLQMGMKKTDIAKKIGMSLATIYREIKRGECVQRKKINGYYGDYTYKTYTTYSADIAEEKFKINMTSKGANLKIDNDFEFVKYVEERVKDGITPCALAGEMKRNRPCKTVVSKTTLYRYIEMGLFMNLKLQYGKKKEYRRVIAKRPPRGTSIEQRPLEVFQRRTFGHWEMDCVCSGNNKLAALLVFTERLTRKEIIYKIPNKQTRTVVSCVNKLERRFGKSFRRVFKSITVDNGVEFSDYVGLEKSIYGGKRTNVFYCHPYSSCERGSNERVNRDIRKKFPKGTDFTNISDKQVSEVERWVNAYPRAIFDYATAEEKFNEQMNLITG